VETPEAAEADCLGMTVLEIEDLGRGAVGSSHQQQNEKDRPKGRRGPDKHRRDGVTPGHAAQLKSVRNIGRSVLGMDRMRKVSDPKDTIGRTHVDRGIPMKYSNKIIIVDRFAPLRGHLLTLLADLGEDDWARPTAAPRWSVKDVTSHLLGGDVSILSGKRDAFRTPQTIESNDQLIELVDRLNAEWVLAARRMSPRLLRELLSFTGPEVEACFASLDPMAMGCAVSWAGPDPAPIWFDLAREFTERWHHQQQIRDATGRPPLYDPYFLSPVLDRFVRALPYEYRNAMAPAGTSVRFEISGEAGGIWFISKGEEAWTLFLNATAEPVTQVVIPQDVAWRLFTKGIDREKARSLAVIGGRADLAAPIFATTAIIG
jgi:uncharacterized protein (TIGR03083 family)